jgi:hypothetical protein
MMSSKLSGFHPAVLLPTAAGILLLPARLARVDILIVCPCQCANPLAKIFERGFFFGLGAAEVCLLHLFEEGSEFVVFDAIDSVLNLEQLVFLKGRSFEVGELALQELFLSLGEFLHGPL